MPKKVDHKKRKLDILSAAVKVFAREGFENSNLSIIAKESHLSRATIYQYFKNKNEVFYYAIRQATENMFEKYNSEIWDSNIHPLDEIEAMVEDIMTTSLLHKDELANLVKAADKLPGNLDEMINRRTIKLQLLFRKKIREGIKANQIIDLNPTEFSKQIIILVESFCFQLAYLKDENVKLTEKIIRCYIQSAKKLK